MRCLLLSLIALSAESGTIQGVVIEHISGRPMARAVVRLQPVAGLAAQAIAVRSTSSGQFVFPSLPVGTYLLTAVRAGYFSVGYEQKRPSGRSMPIQVTQDSKLFAELRLRRMGAVTGQVMDENGIGTAGVNVLAYPAKLPLRSAGTGISDDRGVYRIQGLQPGKYWVRSGSYTLEDNTGWLPTFAPSGREVRDARIFPVALDSDTAYADVRPVSGDLFSVEGAITCRVPSTVEVTLSSEIGQFTSSTTCGAGPGAFRFQGLAPGAYEILAAAQNNSLAAFEEFYLARNLAGLNLSLAFAPAAEIDAPPGTKLAGRRQNLSESGPLLEIATPRAALLPGYWEIRATVPPGSYVESIGTVTGARQRRAKSERASAWFEVFVEPLRSSRIRVVALNQALQISGRVLGEGKPLAGVPVFLWPVAEAARRSLNGALETISDLQGGFNFEGVPPGEYRLLASFDVTGIDEELVEVSRAVSLRAEAGQSRNVELALWSAPY